MSHEPPFKVALAVRKGTLIHQDPNQPLTKESESQRRNSKVVVSGIAALCRWQ